jgi:hypothetical protein
MQGINAALFGASGAEDVIDRQARWREEMLLQRPVISSAALQALIDQFSSILEETWRRALTPLSDDSAYVVNEYGDQVERPEIMPWLRRLAVVVKRYAENLGTALAAHRADLPLPPALPCPEWPELRLPGAPDGGTPRG